MVSLEKVPLANFGVIVAEPKTISVPGGDVRHGLSLTDDVFNGFGEAYFSNVAYGAVKAWKKHTRLTMNLLVPVGLVEFVFVNPKDGVFASIEVGEQAYRRLTVKPNIWFGFCGLFEKTSIILNIADMKHDPSEVKRLPTDQIQYFWGNL